MANYSNNRLEMKNIGKERDLFVSAKDIDEINNGSKQDEVLEFNLSKVVDIDDDYKWVSSTRICDDSVDFLGYRDKILSEEVLIKLSNIFNDREITYIYSQEFEILLKLFLIKSFLIILILIKTYVKITYYEQ